MANGRRMLPRKNTGATLLGLLAIGHVAAWATPAAHAAPEDFLSPVTDAGFCFDCRAQNVARFEQLTRQFQRARRSAVPERLDDFVVSRVGVLIHEDCFAAFGDRIDVEQVVTDAVITGFQCMLDQKDAADRRFRDGALDFADGGAIVRDHIPRLLRLFTRHQAYPQAVAWGFTPAGSTNLVTLADPCRDHAQLGYPSLQVHSDCRHVAEVPLGQPKLFCSIDALSELVTQRHHRAPESTRALATLPQMAYPVYKNWQGRTRVYNAPMITLLPLTHDMAAGVFMSTLWHELLHNAGYEHGSDTHADPYFCQTACFWQEHAARWQPPITRIQAAHTCATLRPPQAPDRALADDIARAFGDR